jgi:hypothetical protein
VSHILKKFYISDCFSQFPWLRFGLYQQEDHVPAVNSFYPMARQRNKHRTALNEQKFFFETVDAENRFSRRVIQVFTSFVKTDACLQGYRPIQNTCCVNISDFTRIRILRCL